jgi:hypothetical protein
MKQARKVGGGANRRERVKRCGRNIGGLGRPVGEWTPPADVVMRERTPREALDAATRRADEREKELWRRTEHTRG